MLTFCYLARKKIKYKVHEKASISCMREAGVLWIGDTNPVSYYSISIGTRPRTRVAGARAGVKGSICRPRSGTIQGSGRARLGSHCEGGESDH